VDVELFQEDPFMSCWCYSCNRSVTPEASFTCPHCHEDYLEYEDPAPPPPAPGLGVRNFVWRLGNVPGAFGTFNPVDIFNTFFTQTQNPGGQLEAQVETWFRGIIQNNPFFNAFIGGAGARLGDFFTGDEGQLQALVERLNQMNARSMGSPPTSPEFMTSLRPSPYHPGEAADHVCAVCLEELEEGAEVIVLPCKHGFHTNCLTPWLKMHSECPYCRFKLPDVG
jgi:hypothetical protein